MLRVAHDFRIAQMYSFAKPGGIHEMNLNYMEKYSQEKIITINEIKLRQ